MTKTYELPKIGCLGSRRIVAEFDENGIAKITEQALDSLVSELNHYAEQEPCEDCDYSEIMDWEQDTKTGKAKPIYWCERHKEPKTGHWIRTYDRIVNAYFWECDKCQCGFQSEYNFCPNCGACMKDGRTLDEFIEEQKSAESEDKE